MRFFTQRRHFGELSEQEILALAISSEEDDAQIYRSYGERLRAEFPDTAAIFDGMAVEEDGHRQALIALHQSRFGNVIPLIRREHVAGFHARRPVWLMQNLSLERIRDEAANLDKIESLQNHENQDIYDKAVKLLETYCGAEAEEDQALAPGASEQGTYAFGQGVDLTAEL